MIVIIDAEGKEVAEFQVSDRAVAEECVENWSKLPAGSMRWTPPFSIKEEEVQDAG